METFVSETGLDAGGGELSRWIDSLPQEEGEVLVVGSSRLGPVERIFLGSNSTKTVRSSPVVVIPRGATKWEGLYLTEAALSGDGPILRIRVGVGLGSLQLRTTLAPHHQDPRLGSEFLARRYRWPASIRLRYTSGPVIVSSRKDCSGGASRARSEQPTEP